jgi:hypothetical protein
MNKYYKTVSEEIKKITKGMRKKKNCKKGKKLLKKELGKG